MYIHIKVLGCRAHDLVRAHSILEREKTDESKYRLVSFHSVHTKCIVLLISSAESSVPTANIFFLSLVPTSFISVKPFNGKVAPFLEKLD